MTVQWEKVYVFISSTFNDMHAERDYMVKQVFPQLQEWCEKRKLRLVDIDLRWGVTEQDATQNKRVVQVCLQRIDACRPFFLCFLGQRRGWVPTRAYIPPETYAQYPELEKYAGTASVTELEILHALVDPLHRGRIKSEGKVTEYRPADYSFFYLRQPEYLDELPASLPQLRQVYTNEGLETATGTHAANEVLRRWREDTIPRTGRPVHSYTAHWIPNENTPEIRLPLSCPSAAPRGSPPWQAAFVKWSKQWGQAGVSVNDDGVISESVEQARAEQYNAHLTQGRLGDFTCHHQPLVESILADLKAAIQARYPEHIESSAMTSLQHELDQQEQMLHSASEGFIERAGDFDTLDCYVQGKKPQVFILSAAGGMGKTSLLARWINRLLNNPALGESLHYRFIGASDGSTSVNTLLRSILSEIQAMGKFTEVIPPDSNKLREALPQLLAAAGKKGRTVIVLDGLNQLESQLSDLSWLPQALPPGIRLIASFKRGGEKAEHYYEQLHTGEQSLLAEVRPFENLEDRRRLVRAYLEQFLKELDEHHVETLIHAEGADNPLYLKVVLAELRVFGAHADLGEKIKEDFGTNPITAFNGVLQRLERDPAYSPVQPEHLAPRLFGWLAHARQGLTVEELTGLLLQEKLLSDRQQAEAAVHGLLRQVRPYLARRDGRLDFFYESFKLAVLARYARRDDEQGVTHPQARLAREWHASLAKYFSPQPLRLGATQTPNRRKLAELAFQQAYAGQTEALKKTLWDYAFMEARLEGADVEALIGDYDLMGQPEAGIKPEDTKSLRLLQDTLKLSEHVLTQDPLQLPGQLTGRLMGFTEVELRCLLEQARAEVKRPWLRPLCASLDAPGGALVRTLTGHSLKVKGVALTSDGRCVVSASDDTTLKVWDMASGACLRTLQGHTSGVESVALTPDGRYAVSASWDHTLKVWDLASGACLRTLQGHTDWVNGVALTPDSRCAVSASNDKTLKLWDLASGACLRTLKGHTNSINSVALTPDGCRAVSASEDKKLRVWDLAKGKCLRILRGHTDSVNSVALMPDGRYAVSASNDKTLKIWDLASGTSERTLQVHTGALTNIALTPDGRHVVVACQDSTLKVFDLASGECLRTLQGHTSGVACVTLTPDGRRAISGSWDDTLKVWDLTSAERSENQVASKKHIWEIKGVALTPDGRRAVSASRDKTLKVWDLTSGECLHTLEGHASWVEGVTLTPDSRFALSASADNTLKMWDLASGDCLRTLNGHTFWVIGVVVTPDGRTAISASEDGTLKVWNLASGEQSECLRTLRGHTAMVVALALTPDGRCAVSASWDHTLKVWDLASGECLHTMHGHAGKVFGVGLTPDGQWAISIYENYTLKVWDLANGECLRTLKGHTSTVTGVALTPDGRCAVSASWDRTLKVWDLASGICLRTLQGHTDWVIGVALSPDGHFAVSASNDKTIKIWNLASGACLASFPGEGVMTYAGSSLTGLTFSAGDLGGAVYFLQLENIPPAPPILTAWNFSSSLLLRKGQSLAFGCPHCRIWSEIPKRVLGSEIPCPNCRKPIRLNSFTIRGDWRSVAKTWKGEK